MVSKTSKLLSAGKSTTTGAAVKALRTADPKAINALKSFIKSPAAKVLSKAVPGLGLASLLATVGSVMGKDSKMSQKLKEQRMKIIEDRAKARLDGKPMKNREKRLGKKPVGGMSDAQKKGASPSEVRAAMREAGRGKAGSKRKNIVKDKRGKAVRDKRGKAVNFGGANKGGKKSREGRQSMNFAELVEVINKKTKEQNPNGTRQRTRTNSRKRKKAIRLQAL